MSTHEEIERTLSDLSAFHVPTRDRARLKMFDNAEKWLRELLDESALWELRCNENSDIIHKLRGWLDTSEYEVARLRSAIQKFDAVCTDIRVGPCGDCPGCKLNAALEPLA